MHNNPSLIIETKEKMKNPFDDEQIIDIDEPNTQKVQIVGYVRVSSIDQNTDRQLDGVKLDKVFTDKATGKTKDRPELQQMLDYVRYGDIVVIHSLDRLARNLEDLIAIINQLHQKGVVFKSLKENLTLDGLKHSPMDKFLLHILGAVAEFNRSLIREAQREGIAKAKKRGVYKGRKSVLTADTVAKIEDLIAQRNSSVENYKKLSNTDIAKQVGISKSSFYRYLEKREKVNS